MKHYSNLATPHELNTLDRLPSKPFYYPYAYGMLLAGIEITISNLKRSAKPQDSIDYLTDLLARAEKAGKELP